MSEEVSAQAAGLRALALETTADSIGLTPTAGGKKVFGVLMETGYAIRELKLI